MTFDSCEENTREKEFIDENEEGYDYSLSEPLDVDRFEIPKEDVFHDAFYKSEKFKNSVDELDVCKEVLESYKERKNLILKHTTFMSIFQEIEKLQILPNDLSEVPQLDYFKNICEEEDQLYKEKPLYKKNFIAYLEKNKNITGFNRTLRFFKLILKTTEKINETHNIGYNESEYFIKYFLNKLPLIKDSIQTSIDYVEDEYRTKRRFNSQGLFYKYNYSNISENQKDLISNLDLNVHKNYEFFKKKDMQSFFTAYGFSDDFKLRLLYKYSWKRLTKKESYTQLFDKFLEKLSNRIISQLYTKEELNNLTDVFIKAKNEHLKPMYDELIDVVKDLLNSHELNRDIVQRVHLLIPQRKIEQILAKYLSSYNLENITEIILSIRSFCDDIYTEYYRELMGFSKDAWDGDISADEQEIIINNVIKDINAFKRRIYETNKLFKDYSDLFAKNLVDYLYLSLDFCDKLQLFVEKKESFEELNHRYLEIDQKRIEMCKIAKKNSVVINQKCNDFLFSI